MAEIELKLRCCEEVRDRDSRWPSYHRCARRGTVKRDGKLYCKTHDPDVVGARSKARHDKWESQMAEDKAICQEAARLAKLLGVDGVAADSWMTRRPMRRLAIPFEDIEKIIARLKE